MMKIGPEDNIDYIRMTCVIESNPWKKSEWLSSNHQFSWSPADIRPIEPKAKTTLKFPETLQNKRRESF
jgi:hypothetical protein